MFQSVLLMSREHKIKHDVIEKKKIYCFNNEARAVSLTFADIIMWKFNAAGKQAGCYDRLYLMTTIGICSKAECNFFDLLDISLLHYFVTYHICKLLFFPLKQDLTGRRQHVFWPCESSGFPSHLRLAEKSCFGLAELLSLPLTLSDKRARSRWNTLVEENALFLHG